MTLVHHFMPYIRLGSLMVITGVLIAGILSSLAELLPGWRSWLSFGLSALLLILVLTRLILL